MSKQQLYVRVGRLLSPLALLGLRVVTMITRQPRVRVVVINEQGEILLVRGVISHLGRWMLPGGGVNRHEKLADAARRELFEETGIKKPAAEFQYLRIVEKSELGLHFDAPLFYVRVKKADLPAELHNPAEIIETGWHNPDKLPEATAPIVFVGLDEYRQTARR